MKKLLLGLCVVLVLAGTAIVSGEPNDITADDFTGCLAGYGCTYSIVWDGWEGFLTLRPDGTGTLEQRGHPAYSVQHRVLLNPQDNIDGMRGPGYQGSSTLKHRIVFWVDFNRTPHNREDDQRFDGYLMTKTKDAIAGVTWWQGIPFGFYATNKSAPLI